MSVTLIRPWCWLALCGLQACSPTDPDTLTAWMLSERQAVQPTLQALAEPVPFRPKAYSGAGLVDPFSQARRVDAAPGSDAIAAPAPAWVAAEMKRRKQPLEAFALEQILLVGTLLSEGQQMALLQVDTQLYLVGVGAYLGQNHGRIQRITDQAVVLREAVQIRPNEWSERPAMLALRKEPP